MKIPLAAIGVDVMVGFPGEGDRAYHNSYSLIDNLPISYLHVFPFSPREGTPAAKFSGQVDQGVIKERARALRDLGHKKRRAFYRSCLGKEFSVLAEGWHSEEEDLIKGLSDNYLSVVFPSSVLIRNRILKIRMEDVEKGVAIGRSP
jgi:threonylcarbamoyladenosine tRNA methylthiotransferase MtaB